MVDVVAILANGDMGAREGDVGVFGFALSTVEFVGWVAEQEVCLHWLMAQNGSNLVLHDREFISKQEVCDSHSCPQQGSADYDARGFLLFDLLIVLDDLVESAGDVLWYDLSDIPYLIYLYLAEYCHWAQL